MTPEVCIQPYRSNGNSGHAHRSGKNRSVSIIFKHEFIKPGILCCVEEICKQFFNLIRHKIKKICNSSFRHEQSLESQAENN